MTKNFLKLYLDTEFTSIRSPGLISVALVGRDGGWFYSEVVDFDRNRLDAFASSNVTPKLMRVRGTSFTRKTTLPGAMAAWIRKEADLRGCDSVELVSHSQKSFEALGTEVVEQVKEMAGLQELRTSITGVDEGVIREFYDHCGGAERVQYHALVEAMGVAIADMSAHVGPELFEIGHLEMLMGTKNAQSYRAWLRRRLESIEAAKNSTLPV